ncbi:hypothetical protein TorRG33x02_010420 [Trema orientale]|uniref:Transmembrane protein n=1 Tax=Trema orientale TaxID=63057 RepID=A0A2P5FYV7_TREOI|nr:hypothetical protein TorRG33x02_010420 [Trema orientale]
MGAILVFSADWCINGSAVLYTKPFSSSIRLLLSLSLSLSFFPLFFTLFCLVFFRSFFFLFSFASLFIRFRLWLLFIFLLF